MKLVRYNRAWWLSLLLGGLVLATGIPTSTGHKPKQPNSPLHGQRALQSLSTTTTTITTTSSSSSSSSRSGPPEGECRFQNRDSFLEPFNYTVPFAADALNGDTPLFQPQQLQQLFPCNNIPLRESTTTPTTTAATTPETPAVRNSSDG